MPTLRDALELAAKGWQVLPLKGKIPATPHGVSDASTSPEQVRQWWRHHDYNIGGRVPPSLMVLDIDPRNGGSVEALEDAAGCKLPRTLCVRSGRGGDSHHRYYLHPGGRLSQRRLPDGIDVKTHTGYCVLPPSIHPATGDAYAWQSGTPATLPPSMVALLRPPRPKPTPPLRKPPSADKRADALVRYVRQSMEGQRNARLFWAACRAVDDGLSRDVFAALVNAAVAVGLAEQECWQTINSALRTTQGGNQ